MKFVTALFGVSVKADPCYWTFSVVAHPLVWLVCAAAVLGLVLA